VEACLPVSVLVAYATYEVFVFKLVFFL
jgi:hypothetical protein